MLHILVIVLGYNIKLTECFPLPDFDSGWLDIASGYLEDAVKYVPHNLHEAPLLVDVQVKDKSGSNKDYIFQATGHTIRDDDSPAGYGGIAYIYDSEYVVVSAPTYSNQYIGSCIYASSSSYWTGPVNQASSRVLFRVRAWKCSSLPKPEFFVKNITLKSKTGLDSFVSLSHGIDEYPSLVISRIKFPNTTANFPNFFADSVGSSLITYNSPFDGTTAFVVYGFDNNHIRVWAYSHTGHGMLYHGTDGYYGQGAYIYTAELEVYAWNETILPYDEQVTKDLSGSLNPSLMSSQIPYPSEAVMLTRAWVQATDGANKGFRFVGSGAATYHEETTSSPCSYGGLLYAYTDTNIRFWKPGNAINGALVCLSAVLAKGTYSQASSNGIAHVKRWTTDQSFCVPHVQADIVFILDTSISQSSEGINKQKNYFLDFISHFHVGQDQFQFSLITYASDAVIHFYLNTHDSNNTLVDAVKGLTNESTGASFINKALAQVNEIFNESNGARACVDRYVIVLTDGLSSDFTGTVRHAQQLHSSDRSVSVYAVGVGDQIFHTELLHISQSVKNVFPLSTTDCLHRILKRAMPICPECSHRYSDVAVVLDVSSSQGHKYFDTMLKAVESLVKHVPLGPDKVQISFSTFAAAFTSVFNFDSLYSKDDMISKVFQKAQNMYNNPRANIANALLHVMDGGFNTSTGAREDTRQIVVLLSSAADVDFENIRNVSRSLKDNGVLLVAVGPGMVANLTVLNEISSDPVLTFVIGDDVDIDKNVIVSLLSIIEYSVCTNVDQK